MSLIGKSKRIRAGMRKKYLLEYEAQKGNASQTRKVLGLGLHTSDKWIKKYPKFAAKIISIDEAIIDEVEITLLENAKAGKQRAIEFFLLNARRKKYRNTQRSEITGADGGPVTYKEEVFEDPNSTTPLPHQVEDKEEDSKSIASLTQREAEDLVRGKGDEQSS